MKTISTTKYDKIFNSDLIEVLGSTNKKYEGGMHLGEKVANIKNFDKVHLKCNCVDCSILDGKRQRFLHFFGLDARPGYKNFEKPSSILYKKLNKDKIDDIIFYLEDDDGNIVVFNGKTFLFYSHVNENMTF